MKTTMLIRPQGVVWNCQPNNKVEDWSIFDGVEVRPVVLFMDSNFGEIAEPIFWEELDQAKADHGDKVFYTIYGHLKEGGVSALMDFDERYFGMILIIAQVALVAMGGKPEQIDPQGDPRDYFLTLVCE